MYYKVASETIYENRGGVEKREGEGVERERERERESPEELVFSNMFS